MGMFFGVLLGWGSAGSALRSQGSSGEDGALALRAGGGLIASYACFGPNPLPLGAMECRRASPWGALISGVDLVFGESWGLVLGFGLGLRGIGPALAGKLGGGWSFGAARWRGFDRFLCLLRPDPAAASCHGVLRRGQSRMAVS